MTFTPAAIFALLNIAFGIYDRAKQKQARGTQLTEDERAVLKAEQATEEERFDRLRSEAEDLGGEG